MRFTVNDAVFSILHSCAGGLRSDRLVYYIYALQKAGLSLKYRYRVQSRGVSCRALVAELNTLVNLGKVSYVNGVLNLTSEGYLYYDNVVLTAAEWEKVCSVKRLLDCLSESELFFVCITDIVMTDMIKRSGVEGLVTGRSAVETTIQNLSQEYSADNFNTALSIMRQIGNGGMYCEG